MSKYEPLWKYISTRKENEFVLTFEDVRDILGFDIEHSFLTYKKELQDYGYSIGKISMKNKTVIVKRSS